MKVSQKGQMLQEIWERAYAFLYESKKICTQSALHIYVKCLRSALHD